MGLQGGGAVGWCCWVVPHGCRGVVPHGCRGVVRGWCRGVAVGCAVRGVQLGVHTQIYEENGFRENLGGYL